MDSGDEPRRAAQHHVQRPDGRNAFLDFAFIGVMLAIEVDGHGSHATRAQRAADAERANQLALLGWSILRFTYEDVRQRPHMVVTTIRRARSRSRDAA